MENDFPISLTYNSIADDEKNWINPISQITQVKDCNAFYLIALLAMHQNTDTISRVNMIYKLYYVDGTASMGIRAVSYTHLTLPTKA